MNPKRFPVFHVPHDGYLFPEELMTSICVPEEQFMRYHKIMRDTKVLEMIPQEWRNKENTVYFPVSRLLCDVERFIGQDEPMELLGMGFCYERSFDGTKIKTVTEELRAKTLNYYYVHHNLLNMICSKHDHILLVDMHSFSEEIIPHSQLRYGEIIPEVCIGIDEAFTPAYLASTVENILRDDGFRVACNYPYSGSLVPNTVFNGKSNCDCISVMLEWSKQIYFDDNGVPVLEKIARIRQTVRRIVDECI